MSTFPYGIFISYSQKDLEAAQRLRPVTGYRQGFAQPHIDHTFFRAAALVKQGVIKIGEAPPSPQPMESKKGGWWPFGRKD
jgi:hypothetical protein